MNNKNNKRFIAYLFSGKKQQRIELLFAPAFACFERNDIMRLYCITTTHYPSNMKKKGKDNEHRPPMVQKNLDAGY